MTTLCPVCQRRSQDATKAAESPRLAVEPVLYPGDSMIERKTDYMRVSFEKLMGLCGSKNKYVAIDAAKEYLRRRLGDLCELEIARARG